MDNEEEQMEYRITLDEYQAEAIKGLVENYWFGLFQQGEIVDCETAEYAIKDVLEDIVKQIDEATIKKMLGEKENG